jgi:hypothetical protein
MILVLRRILRINEEIIELADYQLVHIRPHAIVHISLEHRRRISQPEWHDPIFELTISGPEGGLKLIALVVPIRLYAPRISSLRLAEPL